MTHLSESNRGLELSELISWENKLLAFDDCTGVVFEVNKAKKCIPLYILMEGDGNKTKGQKTEWAAVKDGDLYAGSFGKPYRDKEGNVVTRNNMWIKRITPDGKVFHIDWTRNFEMIQNITGFSFPGYMVHETIHW